MRCSLVLAAGVAALSLGASPASAQLFDSIGPGAHTCAQFAAHYGATKDPETIDYYYYYWAQGYMSGLNAALIGKGKKPRVLKAAKNDENRQFLRQYCSENPLKNYSDAVVELMASFPEDEAAK